MMPETRLRTCFCLNSNSAPGDRKVIMHIEAQVG